MLSAFTNNVVGLTLPLSISIQTLIIRVLHLPTTRPIPLLHHFCYISVTSEQNVGNNRYVQGAGLDQASRRIRGPSFHVDVLRCGVMRGLAWTRSSGGRCETGAAYEASGN
jgi:hypothetical protein